MTRGSVRKWVGTVRGAWALCLALPAGALAWGPAGHEIVTRASLTASAELPAWFRGAGNELAELSNVPDRWRAEEKSTPALAARAPDHFFDLDVWGSERLPGERWAFVHRAERRRLVAEVVGFLPFAILEEYGMLVSAFRGDREHRAGSREAALVAAGVLAHLLGDAVVPLHATRHHHGWIGPDPEGFTRDPGVHHWFESTLVEGIGVREIEVDREARASMSDPPAVVLGVLRDSLGLVPHVYRCEREHRLRGDDREARQLVRERLVAGATLVARFWRNAWRASGA